MAMARPRRPNARRTKMPRPAKARAYAAGAPRRMGKKYAISQPQARSNSADHLPPKAQRTQEILRRVDGILFSLVSSFILHPGFGGFPFFIFRMPLETCWNVAERPWNRPWNIVPRLIEHEMKGQGAKSPRDPLCVIGVFCVPNLVSIPRAFPPPPNYCRWFAQKAAHFAQRISRNP